jgi:transglycosylase-like protein with SLT domain
MRSNAWMLLLAVFLLTPTALVAKEPETRNVTDAQTVPEKQPSREEICRMIEDAAAKESLPFDFFTRLIWRESRFDTRAVSPAGAQGIAQFMPKTANGRGLDNPFDPLRALEESAEYLRELLQRFGNLGLAAAAYNAGPKRIQDWLARRGPPLRQETHDYVEIITGHAPKKWAAEAPEVERVQESDCDQIAKLAIARQVRIAAQAKLARASEQRGAEKRKVEKVADRRSGKLTEVTGRARASAAKSAAKSRPRADKIARLAAGRSKSANARSGKVAAEKIKTAGKATRTRSSVRVAAKVGKAVDRDCLSARNGGRKCRAA